MKTNFKAALLPLLAAVAALATSCSVQRSVHTARSLSIDAKVMQMPTVAELEISPRAVKVDTAWVNHTFRGVTTLKTQEQELVARILAEAGADVLVEPKTAHESRRHWFRNSHRLSVSGYPARYKQFRSATREDMEVINDLLHPDRNRPVVLTQTAQTPSLSGIGKTTPIQLLKAKSQKSKFTRKTGYRGFIDGGYGLNLEDSGGNGYGITTTHGYQINRRLFVGLGAGFYGLSMQNPYDEGKNTKLLPVYFDVRSDVLKSRVSPYVNVRAGYECMDRESYYFAAGFGVGIGHFDIGGEYSRFGNQYSNKDTGVFRVRIGVSF